ncbi:MAG TPA: deoxyhypusine synthase family protein, partial [Ktedonobacterales bacterium]
ETPDYGSYGGARGTLGTAGASEPVQLNATASISGLLDKLGGTGLGGRTVGRALDEWERLARDPDCQVVLALSTPVVGAGLGELLAAAIGRRYVDIVVMSGEDVFADVRAALGFGSTANMDDPASGAHDVGLEPTRDFLAGLAATLAREADRDLAGWEFTRALGKRLAEHAPRTGVLRAAVAADVPVFAPDLVAGPCGLALALAQRRGAAARLDPLADLTALADLLAACAHYGVIAAGSGVATATVTQADELAGRATRSAGGVYLDVAAGTGPVGAGVVVAQSPPGLVLPLLLTGLAQRLPGTIRTPAVATTAHSDLAR